MTDLHMVSLEVSSRRLVEDAQRRGLALRDLDPGYLVHAWIEGTFGPARLRPFSIDHLDTSKVRILAYATAGAQQLEAEAATFATPEQWGAADWASLRTKPMPGSWTSGQRLGFQAQVCPVVRQASPSGQITTKDGASVRGHEVDAWLAACRRAPAEPAPTRAEVYVGWLRDALDRSGGARLLEADLVQFQLSNLHRRTQGERRLARTVSLPNARLRGTIEVADPAAFAELLKRGVGRHRAFGFGMLLLEPAR